MDVQLDGKTLTIEQVASIAREGGKLSLTKEAREKVKAGEATVVKLVESGEAIYGVTTGIGEFARIRIDPEMGSELQKRIIYSHAAGCGDLFPPEVVKSAMVARANVMATGHTGTRESTVDFYIEMFNRGVVPVVNEKGSVGTSGDLSPLSQLAEVCLGEGEAFVDGVRMSGAEALKKVGLEPLVLSYKEGLGLINGSQMMTGEACLQLMDARRMIKSAIIAAAMTIDALKGVLKAYHPLLHAARPHPGQMTVAKYLNDIFADSEIMADKSGKVQDGYSMRCTPQVQGPTIDIWHFAKQWIERELNSAADNPLFFPEQNLHLAGGNFHGQGIGLAIDYLTIAVAELADLSERHTNRLLNPVLSGLPDFLVEGRGLNSGLMVAQYTAASLVSENKVFCHPGSCDSISVSADQEDHVSMGPISIRKFNEVLKNVAVVIGIEAMCAAQAFDFRKPQKPGRGCKAAYDLIRKHVERLEDDRVLYPDVIKCGELVWSGELVDVVEGEIGEIDISLNHK
ncbi:MAG TPA: histidine ammonia-lyase [Firmicutes bacterium]|nr:histidine ammonia-lyase [Bacillota bacterium]